MNHLKICFICSEYPPVPHGGIGTFTRVLARALARAGHQVRVVGVYRSSCSAPDYEEDQGVRVWRLRQSTHRLGWIPARHQLFRTVAAWSRNGEIDLVEVPDYQGWAAGWPRLPVPVVARLNGNSAYFAAELGRSPKRNKVRLERASLQRADFWCAVSCHMAKQTRQLLGLRSDCRAILYNPVEVPTDVESMERSKNQVIFTGTFVAKKGVIPLIKAWPRVLESCQDAELHMFGKDGLTDEGQSMQTYLLSLLNGQAKKSVHIYGHVAREKLFEALGTARVAVFPSYAETYGIAPFEAMTCGCPTIYTKRPPGPELIRDGMALLVDPDQPSEIADAIVRVLKDDALAQSLGVEGRKRVKESYSVEALLPQNEAFFESCLRDFRKVPVHA